MAHRVNGQVLAAELYAELATLEKPDKFIAGFVSKGDAISAAFQVAKQKAAAALGIDYRIYEIPGDANNDAARKLVGRIATHRACGGAIVQLPLHNGLNTQYALNAVPPEKDIDVLGERALGAFYAGRGSILPPAAAVVEHILRDRGVELHARMIAVVGAGKLIGRPVATRLTGKTKELLIIDKGGELGALGQAKIVVLGTGVARLIRPGMLSPDTGVIDFGYAKIDGDLSGDLDASDETGLDRLSFYTPTPGGTGPLVIAHLIRNFYLVNRALARGTARSGELAQ